jgi:hypothetical protein
MHQCLSNSKKTSGATFAGTSCSNAQTASILRKVSKSLSSPRRMPQSLHNRTKLRLHPMSQSLSQSKKTSVATFAGTSCSNAESAPILRKLSKVKERSRKGCRKPSSAFIRCLKAEKVPHAHQKAISSQSNCKRRGLPFQEHYVPSRALSSSKNERPASARRGRCSIAI